MNRHATIDSRSLAFGQAIATRLREHPELIQSAKTTLDRWLSTCSPRTRPALEEWRAAMEGPLEGVDALLTSSDEKAVRLRQSNPFAGLLPPSVRNAILLRYRDHDAASA